MTNLIPVDISPVSLFQKGKLEPFLAKVKRAVDEFKKTSEVETAGGRKAVASFAYKIAQSSVLIDKAGKNLNEEKRAAINLVDEDRRRSKTFLKEEQVRVRNPLTEWEEAEKKLIAEEAARIELEADHTEALAENDLFNRQRAVERKEVEIAKMLEERRIKEEAERLKKERAEQDERLKKEAAEQAREEASEKIRKAEEKANQAERDRIVAEEKAVFEKDEAVRREKERAVVAAREREDKRIAKEAAERAERDKKARHHKHRKRVEGDALVSFVEALGCTHDEAYELVKVIKSNKIKNVTINY